MGDYSSPVPTSTEYWRDYLDGIEPCYFPALNNARLRNHESEVGSVEIPADRTAIQSFCVLSGCSEQILFKTAWALILRCYTGQERPCFGFLSTKGTPVPNWVLLANTDPLGKILAALELDAFDQRMNEYPSEGLAMDADHDNLPLFNTALADSGDAMSLLLSLKLDAILHFDLSANRNPLRFLYRTAHICAAQAVHVAHTMAHVLSQISDHPKETIGELDLLSQHDLNQIFAWNSTMPDTTESCIQWMVEEQVRRTPDAPAVCAWDGNLTYRELDAAASALAQHLRQFGVGPDVLVPVCFEKSVLAVVAQLAVLKAGGACVPMDPSHPRDRLGKILAAIDSRMVVVAPQLTGIFTGLVQHVFSVTPSNITTLHGREPPRPAASLGDASPTNAAFVVFTSGSTGTPKGIILEHRALCTSIRQHGRAMQFSPKSRVLQFAAYTFDVSIGDIFTTLIHGGCVCVPSAEDRMSNLAGVINAMRVNQVYLTPTVASILQPSETPGLEILSLGGEVVTRQLIEAWAGKVHLINIYGPAETSIWCTYLGGLDQDTDPTNIGRAIGCRCWIVDQTNHAKLAPVGAVGEIVIEGPILARSYLGDPAQTAAAFIENPAWSRGQGGHRRLYKSGDLGRYNMDGTISCVGRKDTQVKLRGQRLEMGEIQYHLRQLLPDHVELVVDVIYPVGGKDEKKVLAAFIGIGEHSTDEEEPPSRDSLGITSAGRAQLRLLTAGVSSKLSQVLPSYMIPSAFIPLVRVPRSASGKTDRKRLRQLGSRLSIEQLAAYAMAPGSKSPPTTVAEKRVQELWAQTLGIPPEHLGTEDDFILLGGDSVNAMKLAAASRTAGISLTVADIIRHPRLSDMAGHCGSLDLETVKCIPSFAMLPPSHSVEVVCRQAASQCHVTPDQIEDIYPCTPIQEGILALSLKQSGSYVGQHTLNLPAAIDLGKYKAAWEETVRSLAVLRTRLIAIDLLGGFFQVVIRENIAWQHAANVEEYLAKDRDALMQPGHGLVRYAIVGVPQRYKFVWTAHHALYDGWSLSLLFKRVEQLYRGVTPLTTVPFVHLIQHLSGKDVAASRSFWEQQLRGSQRSTFPALPSIDYQPYAEESLSVHTIHIPPRESHVTISTLIRAAWSLVLAQYSETPEDVVFGSTLTGRNAPIIGIEEMIGPIMTTVPVRVCWNSTQRVGEFLKQIQTQYLDMIPFEHTGIQNIRRILDTDARGGCDFQTLLIVQPPQEADLLDHSHQLRQLDDVIARGYAIMVEFMLRPGAVDLRASYDSKLLPSHQMRRMVFQFEHVIQQLCVGQQFLELKDIEVISPEDIKELRSWNSRVPPAIKGLVHTALLEQARRTPNLPAISSWDGEVSYDEFDRLSSTLSHHLKTLGVGPEVYVPLCFEKSLWSVVCNAAVLRAGGACVSVDPSHPRSRLEGIFEDVDARLIITSPSQAPLFADGPWEIVVVGADFFTSRPATYGFACQEVRPENAAFVVFTSGSTGKPKGIVQDHTSYCSNLRLHGRALGAGPGRRVLQFSAHTFDAFLSDVMTTLAHGGCVCIPSEHDRVNDLGGFIARARVNQACLTPSVINLLRPDDLPGLQVLTLSGEVLSKENLRLWAPHRRVINLYGPSEVTIWCTYKDHVGPNDDPRDIGTAIGCLAWITNPGDPNRLAPLGAVGEMLIEGPGLARGYIKNKRKTDEAFIQDPIWMRKLDQGSRYPRPRRLYRTGDLARYNPGGGITILGRIDTQVKLRGLRIELEEIEHHLKLAFPNPIEGIAVDVIMTGVDQKQNLVAFVCLGKDLDPDSPATRASFIDFTKGLERKLSHSLPIYMIPSLFIPVLQMPRTIHGKLDRKYLRQMFSQLSPEQIASYTMEVGEKRKPTTKMESVLHGIWGGVLSMPPDTIGVDDSFIRLGGDSIGAMRLVATAESRGILLTVADIFRQPVLSDLARVATWIPSPEAEIHATPNVTKPFALLPTDCDTEGLLLKIANQCRTSRDRIQDMYPCTPLQAGLIALTVKEPGAYTFQNIFRLPAGVDRDSLRDAWSAIVRANPILRTAIVDVEGYGHFQVVLDHKLAWGSSDSLQTYIAEDERMSISYGDLLHRYALVTEQPEGEDRHGSRCYFVWTTHHSCYDGWSMNLLLDQLHLAYQGRSLPPSPPYSRFIRYLAESDHEASDAFWRAQLAGVEHTQFPPLPFAAYTPRVSGSRKHTISIARKPQTSITTPTILRAAWALILASYVNSTEVVYGLTLSGRNAPLSGITEIVGPTLATVPTRVHLDRSQSVSSYLVASQRHGTDLIGFEQVGLQHIRRLSGDCQAACQFQNLLIIQPHLESGANFFLTREESASDTEAVVGYGLVIECTVMTDSIDVTAGYDTDLLSHEQVGRILHQLDLVVQQLNEEAVDRTLNNIELFSCADLAQVQQWNSIRPRPASACAHHYIEDRVRATPDALAIVGWDETFTYQELDLLAARLARHLVQCGIGPEMIVPLHFEKSAWSMVAILGVIKAGAAFVFLDPSHPFDRVRGVVQRVNSKLILASRQSTLPWAADVPVMVVDRLATEEWPHVQSTPAPPVAEVRLDNALYIIFTSGSTGQPKGCVIEHGSFCTGALAQIQALSIKPHSRVLQFASYTFDVSILETLTALMAGACVCVPSEETRRDDIAAMINLMDISWAFLTPAAVKLLHPGEVPTLKTLVLGGEALSRQDIERWAGSLQLINGYGPTECSIGATCNPHLTPTTHPGNIGRAIGGVCWIVDADNHDRLLPLGAVGELLIEGPIVARGYLGDPERTAQVFIQDPQWLSVTGRGAETRFYKTGDLVRYNPDGTINFICRKDAQVKLRGLRIELEEIEYHLLANPLVQHSLVVLPTMGPYKRQLVAVLSLRKADAKEAVSASPAGQELQLVDEANMPMARSLMAQLPDALSAKLPSYMVPTTWIFLDSIPLLSSGKINRVHVKRWVQDMDQTVSRQIADLAAGPTDVEYSDMAARILGVWSSVLNIPPDQIGSAKNCSFLSMGGDSITAMQVMRRCRTEGIRVTVPDILRCRNVSQLAAWCNRGDQAAPSYAERPDVPFELAPIQQLYARMSLHDYPGSFGPGRQFNQSFFVRVKQEISTAKVAHAIQAIVGRHSMLRARFMRGLQEGSPWRQIIRGESEGSYAFQEHHVQDLEEARPLIQNTQYRICISTGPVFSADLFHVSGKGQYLFLAAHHLVVDLVSWRIILQDMEDLLRNGVLAAEKPFSFQSWCSLQAEYSRQHLTPDQVMPYTITPANLAYWGMEGRSNTFRDTLHRGFSLSAESTARLLGQSNDALRTHPIELFISALLHSFSKVFKDRKVPTVYLEGHGREPWDPSIDVSSTVGWFTTMCPLPVEVRPESTLVETIKCIKDTRRAIPRNGWPYFASRMLNSQGIELFGSEHTAEVAFNYLGLYQQLECHSALLEQAGDAFGILDDVGPDVQRLALFDVSAVISWGHLQISVDYNRAMKQPDQIDRWIHEFKLSLVELDSMLTSMEHQLTLSDFPLLGLDEPALDRLLHNTLPALGVNAENGLEDIYPCSPLQEYMLHSQSRGLGYYQTQTIFKIVPPRQTAPPVDIAILQHGWQIMVQRHAVLRTVFAKSVSRHRAFDQVVLRNAPAPWRAIQCPDGRALQVLHEQSPLPAGLGGLPYQLTCCQTPNGDVFCKLEASHAILDGASLLVLLRELALAYQGSLAASLGPLFSDYIGYLLRRPSDLSREYWRSYLNALQPCNLPTIAVNNPPFQPHPEVRLRNVTLHLNEPQKMQAHCESHSITQATCFHTAWAIVLAHYCGMDAVCFGYLVSGRDAPIPGLSQAVGLFFNTLACRVQLGNRATTMAELLHRVQTESVSALPHQDCFIWDVLRPMGLSAPFNTLINYSKFLNSAPDDSEPDIEFKQLSSHDPFDYDLVVAIEDSPEATCLQFRYWDSKFSEKMITDIARAFQATVLHMVEGGDKTVGDVRSVLEAQSSQHRCMG